MSKEMNYLNLNNLELNPLVKTYKQHNDTGNLKINERLETITKSIEEFNVAIRSVNNKLFFIGSQSETFQEENYSGFPEYSNLLYHSNISTNSNKYIHQTNVILSRYASEFRMSIIDQEIQVYNSILTSFDNDDDSTVFDLQYKLLQSYIKYDYSILGESCQKFISKYISDEKKISVFCSGLMLFPKDKLGSFSESIISMLINSRNSNIVELGLELLYQWRTPELISFFSQTTLSEDWMNFYLKGLQDYDN